MPRTDEMTSKGTVKLLVEMGPSGRPVFENVPARSTAPGVWILEASPGLAMGTASGDVVKVDPDGSFRVIERAGNIAIHVGAPRGAEDHLNELTARLQTLGGWFDGRGWTKDGTNSLSVYTVPIGAGFTAIQEACDAFAASVSGGEWYYANIYDPADDKTPLNWWKN